MDANGIQTQGRMQQGTLSKTLVDCFEDDTLVAKLATQPEAYRHYPIPSKKTVNQRAAHQGHNMLCGEAIQIQEAREKQEHAKHEKKIK